MNEVTLIGRSGANAELRHTQTGFPVANISIATSEKDKKTNEYTSTWHRVVLLGKLAESMAPYILKGSEVIVKGKINYNEYTDKNGVKQKTTDIVAYMVKVCQKTSRPQQQNQDEYQQQGSSQPAASSSFMDNDLNEMDIPF